MIHVIARIELHDGCKKEFLNILNRNIPNVKAEKGCLAYEPAVEVESGLPNQEELRQNAVMIIETRESIDALYRHLKTPHMAGYREAVKDLVKSVNLQVLEPAG